MRHHPLHPLYPPSHDRAVLRAGIREGPYAHLFAGKSVDQAHAILEEQRFDLPAVTHGGREYRPVNLAFMFGFPRGCQRTDVEEAMK